MAPLVSGDSTFKAAQQLNESIVVCKFTWKKAETRRQFTRKNYHFTFDMYGLHPKYIGIKHSLKSINEDVCRVFKRPFASMNDPESKQIFTRANKLFCTYFLEATDWTYT